MEGILFIIGFFVGGIVTLLLLIAGFYVGLLVFGVKVVKRQIAEEKERKAAL